MSENPLETSDLPLPRKLTDALARISIAMRAESWEAFGQEGLNPTQGQILLLLHRRNKPLRLSEIADELAVTPATVSDSVTALASKGLIVKNKCPDDQRALAVSLDKPGLALLRRFVAQEQEVGRAASVLPESEQIQLYRSLLVIIRELLAAGRIPMARMCVTCVYFRPNAHPDSATPHHCALVDAPLADRTLRCDCPEHQVADALLASANWSQFLNH